MQGSARVPFLASAMSLSELLKSEGLSEALVKVAIDAGWSINTFRHAADSPAELEKVLPEIFGSSELTRLQVTQIRAAWSSLGSQTAQPTASSQPHPADQGSWVESFAPKITSAKLAELKKKFLASYTSELLTPSTMPSLRLISLAAHQEAKQDFKWIPWKHRMTEERAADLLISRPSKQPRLEMLGISSLLIDEPPTLEVSDNNLGISGVQRILAVRDFALAMVGSAHLVRLKSYRSKFLQLLTQRYEPASGLRPPSILEAQQADCKLWQLIYSLVQDKDWKLNDAIFEITEVRGDMASLLQARPKPLQHPRPEDKGGKGKGLNRLMSESWRGGFSEKGKGQGKEKGQKGKGSSKGASSSWVKNVQVNGEAKQLCMLWQSGKCSRGANCAFIHACAYPKSDGTACMSKSHNAMNHANTSH